MELVTQEINTTTAFDTFKKLIASADLPTEDLDFEKQFLIGYYEDDSLMATGGLEVFGANAILRSLTVRLGSRNKSLGSGIVDDLVSKASEKGVNTIYLLTETAKDFFKKKGFEEIDRQEAPDTVKASSEFSFICGDNAVCMKLSL
jgi:amino-acid N-acetyltransferase